MVSPTRLHSGVFSLCSPLALHLQQCFYPGPRSPPDPLPIAPTFPHRGFPLLLQSQSSCPATFPCKLNVFILELNQIYIYTHTHTPEHVCNIVSTLKYKLSEARATLTVFTPILLVPRNVLATVLCPHCLARSPWQIQEEHSCSKDAENLNTVRQGPHTALYSLTCLSFSICFSLLIIPH